MSQSQKKSQSHTHNKILVNKRQGGSEAFDPDKLCSSLMKSGAPEELAHRVCAMVEEKLTPQVTSQKIWRTALKYLVKEDLHISARYSLRRAMANLGPDGYLFEKFAAAVLSQQGYKTETNKNIKGASGLSHEIDVLATKAGQRIYIEAKYKNQYGLKTHVDEVMYSWARFDDILEANKKLAKYKDKKFEVWMVTNTEFTSSSKIYAKYKKSEMKLLGWDYPAGNSLEDMIAETRAYPISILPSLSKSDRKAFIHEGAVLIQDILLYSAEEMVKHFAIDPKRAERYLKEARALSELGE